jgi:hypothetical protein
MRREYEKQTAKRKKQTANSVIENPFGKVSLNAKTPSTILPKTVLPFSFCCLPFAFQ